MNKIIVALLIGFFGGVLAQSFYDFGWSFALFFIFLGLLLAGIFYFAKLQKFALLAGLFILAFGFGIIRYEIKEAKSAGLENQIGAKVVFQGVIIDEPDEKENYTRLVVEEGKTKTKILATSRRYPVFHYGDKVEVSGILKKPENFDPVRDGSSATTAGFQRNPISNGVDWPAYLAKDDIYFEMIYPQIKLLPGSGGSWIERQLFSVKEKFIANLSSAVPEPNAGFLAGLTVGAKQAMPKSLLDNFRRAGIIHIVVLSGYNVTIVADVVMRILKGLPLFVGTGFGVLGILLFTLMTGASATVVRASIMAGLVLLARLTGRIYHITIALFAAGFLMILHNPKILRFDASFQLSFLATLALILVSPLIEPKLTWVPKKFKLRETLSSTISTQIFVLPFLLYQMGLFSTVGLAVNSLILLFVPATMLFGFLSGGIGFISQILSIPFGWIAYALSAYELWVVNVFLKLPFASFNISISFWLMLLIYAGYAIYIYKLKKEKQP